jgi:predicted ATP-dependent endonuclease of OLD family
VRLRRFEVKNFKAIQNVAIDWQDLLVLIGENNCGKSCVLLALDWFLSGSSIKDTALFHKYETGPDNAIELTGYFDQLTDEDKSEVAVKGRMNGDEWVLKKKFWFEKGKAGDAEKGSWKEQLYSYSSEEKLANWPDPATSWKSFPADYEPLIQQIPNLPAKPNNEAREALKQLVRQQHPDLVQQTAADWIANPGGGGNWKSNANSIIPRAIYVRAVHEASDETNAKDASTYGKLINLIVERKLSKRAEVQRLKTALDDVMELFRPDAAHPEHQADEIRVLQERISQGLNEVIGGQAFIKTEPLELRSLLLPSTSLVIRDPHLGIETLVTHQGHGLQRTLIMTLLQLLADVQNEPDEAGAVVSTRPTVLIIEEPELYMHPQMERRMRDVLYRLASQQRVQVACCTHSPVFLDIADKYKSIVCMVKAVDGRVSGHQVTQDLFPGDGNHRERERLKTVARFNPAVNELFFSNHVVLFEESSAIAAFERAAELTGLFERHPRLRREVTPVDCDGKPSIPGFQRILNAFSISYRVVHDEDRNNPNATENNLKIAAAAGDSNPPAPIHFLGPNDLESTLGYQAPKRNKRSMAVAKVEELVNQGALPQAFTEAMNFIYFGTLLEPPAA